MSAATWDLDAFDDDDAEGIELDVPPIDLPPMPEPLETPRPKPALTLRYGFDTTTAQPLGTVVEGILHAGSVSLIYGPPKSGKSFLVTDLALSIAAEELDWMGHDIVTTRTGACRRL